MGRKAVISILLVISFLSLQSCRNTESMYIKPTERQINKFIEDNKLKPLAIRTINESFTVILYETPTESGYYSIRTDTKGRLYETQKAIPKDFQVTPVFTTGVYYGIPFVVVIINDETIRKKANTIEVKFVNGNIVYAVANGSKGYIIANEKAPEGEGRYFEVIIYDKDKKILFPKQK